MPDDHNIAIVTIQAWPFGDRAAWTIHVFGRRFG